MPFLLRVLRQRKAVTILCYHDLPSDIASHHLDSLANRYNFVSLRHYVDWRTGRSVKPLPSYPLVITLDDGHQRNALLRPVLERTGVPVTVFLCSAIADTHRHFWWTVVRDSRERQLLKGLPDEARLAKLARMGYGETREYHERQALSKEEIEGLKSLVDFQSHTRFHPVLVKCPIERATDEIAGSKAELEDHFGLSIYALAYPNGDYSETEIELANEAGYECALTLDGGYNTAHTDLFRLKRIPVDDHAGDHELLVKASGLWDLIIGIFSRRSYGYRVDRTAVP